ncbi:unnamed protein product, partial [Closterium sp. NIES-53]
MAAQELHWLTYLLTDLGERPRSPPVLYLQQRGQLRLTYVTTRGNTADIFTKVLPPGDHQRFCTLLGLVPTLPHLLLRGDIVIHPELALHFLTGLAWRPSLDKGVVLGSVAQNGQQWNDGAPFFYGTVSCIYDSHGYGYSMTTGEFGNDNPNIDIAIGKAGEQDEGVIDVSIAWFPYHQGWTAGYVDAPSQLEKGAEAKWATNASYSPNLPSDLSRIMRWDGRGASLELPGVNPSQDGMLFLTSTDPGQWSNELNIMSTYVKRKGSFYTLSHAVAAYILSSLPSLPTFALPPLRLIGATIAADGAVVRGSGMFSCRRLGLGMYEISINNEHKTHKDGILLLQVMGRDDSNRRYARHTFLSYNFTAQGSMLVEGHRLVKEPAEMFKETFPYIDTDFAFVWVDFRNPLSPTLRSYTGPLPPRLTGYRFWSGIIAGIIVMVIATAAAVFFLSRHSISLVPSAFAPLTSLQPTDSVSAETELAEELLRGVYINAED